MVQNAAPLKHSGLRASLRCRDQAAIRTFACKRNSRKARKFSGFQLIGTDDIENDPPFNYYSRINTNFLLHSTEAPPFRPTNDIRYRPRVVVDLPTHFPSDCFENYNNFLVIRNIKIHIGSAKQNKKPHANMKAKREKNLPY